MQVLRQLFSMCFITGSAVPLPDVVHHLLQLPCPAPQGPPMAFALGGARLVVHPPDLIGAPRGELPLQPLAAALGPDALLMLFAGVLLERRVLLRAQQPRLLTLVGEGLVRLLYPLSFPHVYIPVVPTCLCDYLEVCMCACGGEALGGGN